MSRILESKRLLDLIRFIENNPYPSQISCIAHLQEMDFQISERTFHRLKKEALELGVEISFNHQHRGYYIAEKEDNALDKVEAIIRLQSYLGYTLNDISDVQRLKGIVRINKLNAFRGHQYIPEIIDAILHCRILEIHHRRFDMDENRIHILKPVQLREFDDRWYLLGMNDKNKIKSFGLDRVLRINTNGDSFEFISPEVIDAQFDHALGPWMDKEPEFVYLRFNKLQAQYMITLPLHASQKIIEEDESSVTFRYYVRPTFDLQKKILQWLPDVAVLGPKWLRNDMKNILKKSQSQF